MEKLPPEKIKELNEIAKLPQDQQQVRLQEFLSTLNDEQIEFLKSQQEQTCPFCNIIFGDITSYKIYEDNKVMAVLDINPANAGHFIVFPKDHTKNSFEMKPEDFGYLMNIVNVLAKMMQSLLKAEGFNILISNGLVAGQKSEHFIIHAIPRFRDDSIGFVWNTKKIDNETNNRIIREFSNFKVAEQKKESNKKYEGNYYEEEERIP